MTHIESISELRTEMLRLHQEKKVLEQRLQAHLKTVSVAAKPSNLFKKAISSLLSDKELSGQLKTRGAEAAIGLLLSQLVLKNANPFLKTAGGILGTTLATTVFGDDASKYVEKIRDLWSKYRASAKESKGTGFNEEEIYNS